MFNSRRIATRHVAPCLRPRSLIPNSVVEVITCSVLKYWKFSKEPWVHRPAGLQASSADTSIHQARISKTRLFQPLWHCERRSLSTSKLLAELHKERNAIQASLIKAVEQSNALPLGDTCAGDNHSQTAQRPPGELHLQQQGWHPTQNSHDRTTAYLGDEHRAQSEFLNLFANYDSVHDDADVRMHLEHSATRPKADLSYHAVQKREAAALKNGLSNASRTSASAFRDGAGIRRMLWHYMQHVEPLLKRSTWSGSEDDEIYSWLSTIFSNVAVQALQRNRYSAEDVASWSWIFDAETVDLSIRRYVFLARKLQSARQVSMPVFVLLQLLRAEYIDAHSLTLLIEHLEDVSTGGVRWYKEPGIILLIRLLRHARFNNARFYERIAELAQNILSFKTQDVKQDEVKRFTHFYNRFLSLLALPLPNQPFLSVAAQQRAQLKIARFMTESRPQIMLNREGYRALARLQLMHEKTAEEQRWSSVKAPSWPPWRRDELGIDIRVEYPGRQSRVAKVIKRLLEAGYGPESMEYEAQILAGWDVDKSPTIQTRKILQRRPLSWLRSLLREEDAQQLAVDHFVWAARVAATRSIREAWVCFYSYMEATTNHKRQLNVYHEMFHKLFARAQQTDQRFTPSPGDGKEVYPDPMSPRDLVYVPKEPPTIAELYGQMIHDGIRPAGRLLANLIDSGQTLRTSLDYVRDSTLDEVKKDVLLHPEKYPGHFIRNIFSTLPDYLLASFIGSLAKHHKSSENEIFWPTAKSVEERGVLPPTQIKPLYQGMALMEIWRPKYLPAYHAILEGVCLQAMTRRSSNFGARVRQYSYSELWTTVRQLLNLLKEVDMQPDLICFRKLVILARNHTIRAPDQFAGNNSSIADVVCTIKSTFVQAVNGRLQGVKMLLPDNEEGGAQPYWKDIEALILHLGFASDFEGVIELLEWLRDQRHLLDCVDDGSYKIQRIVCAARVALEATWTGKEESSASNPQVLRAKGCIDTWGWPEKVDIDEYMKQHGVWFDGMRAAIKQR